MISFVAFTLCFLLTGLNSIPIQDCTHTHDQGFLRCIKNNWNANEQKILQLTRKIATIEQQNTITAGLSRKLKTDEQQNKIRATEQQKQLLQLTKR